MTKRMRSRIHDAEMSVLVKVARLSFRGAGGAAPSSGGGGAWNRHLTGTPLFGDFLNMDSWTENLGQTQSSVERVHVLCGLETTLYPPGGAGGCHWGEKNQGFPPGLVATMT